MADLSRALELDPSRALDWAGRAAGRLELGDWDGATRDAEEASRLDPRLAAPWRIRGAVLVSRRRWDQALAHLTRALELDSRAAAAHHYRGVALRMLGRRVEAEQDFRAALAIEPGLELGWWSALRAGNSMRRFDTAVAALDELEKTFGYTLGPEAFEKDPSMADLLLSSEYETWLDSREQNEAADDESD